MYTLKEAARRVGVHWITLYRWERDGKIPRPPVLQRNGRRQYSDADIEAIRQFKDATK